MSHKVHPFIFRLGPITTWKSKWFRKKNYRELLEWDVKLREFLSKKLARAGVKSIEMEYSAGLVNIIIKSARPGLIIGRGGGGVEELKKEIKSLLRKGKSELAKIDVRLEIEEVRNPSSQAAIVAPEVAVQIEKRMPYRRAIKQALDKITQNNDVLGVKIMIKGRLNGTEIARKEWLSRGRIPLQTMRSDIDYARATAYTTYGTIGIKIWIYKGEVFDKE